MSAAATRKETNVQTMIKCFRQYISCFGENGSEEGGIVFAYDTRKTEDVKEEAGSDDYGNPNVTYRNAFKSIGIFPIIPSVSYTYKF